MRTQWRAGGSRERAPGQEQAAAKSGPRAAEQRGRRRWQQRKAATRGHVSSFALRLAAEGKAAKTIRTYTEAVRWFAAACLPGQASRASWEQVGSQDIQRWMAWLLNRYSTAYASNQYRALQQFFKWLAVEDELPDPMQGLQPPRVADKLVPVFTDGVSYRGWKMPVRAAASRSAAIQRSSRC